MKWQPIESAPKDGTLVLLHLNGCVETGFYSRTSEIWHWGAMVRPTHWMPLPNPPMTIPEQPSKLSKGEQPLPTELEKAIQQLRGAKNVWIKFNHDIFEIDISIILTATKQSIELRKELEGEQLLVKGLEGNIKACEEHNEELQQQSLTKDEVIKKLVEALKTCEENELSQDMFFDRDMVKNAIALAKPSLKEGK